MEAYRWQVEFKLIIASKGKSRLVVTASGKEIRGSCVRELGLSSGAIGTFCLYVRDDSKNQ